MTPGAIAEPWKDTEEIPKSVSLLVPLGDASNALELKRKTKIIATTSLMLILRGLIYLVSCSQSHSDVPLGDFDTCQEKPGNQ